MAATAQWLAWAYFLRMTLTGGHYRLKIVRRLRQAICWRLPPMRSLARWQSWSITAGILASAVENNLPLPDALDAAAHAQTNLSARRRLLRGMRLLHRGASPYKVLRKAGVPRAVRNLVTGTPTKPGVGHHQPSLPAGSLASALRYVESFYRAKYCAAVEWTKSLAIPVTAIIFGAGALAVALYVFIPYVQYIKFLEAKGGF